MSRNHNSLKSFITHVNNLTNGLGLMKEDQICDMGLIRPQKLKKQAKWGKFDPRSKKTKLRKHVIVVSNETRPHGKTLGKA